MSGKKLPQLAGFNAINANILISNDSPENTPSDHPAAILIYGWGDGQARHVGKYADGYRTLFPHSKQIIILSPISDAMFTGLETRMRAMQVVIDNLNGLLDEKTAPILVHSMSNTGAISYATTLKAFADKQGRTLPHQLLVLDSTPGNPFWSWERLGKWSHAMAIGTAKFFPWPFVVTKGIWGFVLTLDVIFKKLIGSEPSGAFALRTVDDITYETLDSKRLYLYSKEDEIISHMDIEGYIAESQQRGYETRQELFDGTNHVGHMREHPEKYWKAIQEAWQWSNDE
ncbi:unnamed protein product [Fusarium graminearum]|uniref:Uncharacterized protein n=1 Tax=Gibberella zeae TaxID=5518 RepID=A0A8H3Q1S5_GIBZA|nr:unnamed protein product [Fusarium graminearum]CAG1999655.1 unnamed protein product [Fusarium graminearum]